jgi:hypothetical protein
VNDWQTWTLIGALLGAVAIIVALTLLAIAWKLAGLRAELLARLQVIERYEQEETARLDSLEQKS